MGVRNGGGRVGRWRRVSVAVALGLFLGAGFGGAVGAAESKVDLNEASLEELTELPGIGPARARAIIERREEAPFESADDLADVPGIGGSLVEKLREHVEVGKPERQAKRAPDER